ncbi:MAG: hypothetical protein RR092_08105, partial [Oscillospiraceae bacterium]
FYAPENHLKKSGSCNQKNAEILELRLIKSLQSIENKGNHRSRLTKAGEDFECAPTQPLQALSVFAP